VAPIREAAAASRGIDNMFGKSGAGSERLNCNEKRKQNESLLEQMSIK
jgi:hypothetical protein